MRSSSTYVHWGMKTCPNVTATSLIFSGQVAGLYTNRGAGEYICLPNDPSYDQYSDAADEYRS
ncbi:hypothetical protein DPMN_040121 [Dreissena polymorpha]|uniref:Uncharacterized protein n=1 Tax=Dreissena polymorpha TaxID=45954 RepID=A0A9D4HV04_DREPO|nr:hypothetical protein DPMN_040105 [Dreissena polymorpha]KAH3733688.1 hypothetical protein DPMN_040121 [Dreissena polymorpha]